MFMGDQVTETYNLLVGHHTGSVRRWVLAIGVAVAAAACGSAASGEAVSPPPRGEASSPFRVQDVPDGYRLAALGRGIYQPDWGSDDAGTTEPFTVLAPEGEEPTEDNVVVVSVTGYEGNQGGFDQAAIYYACTGGGRRDEEVDGRRALFTPAADCENRWPWSELLVDRGHDLAVRVRVIGWSRDELVELERGVVPADRHERAPAVTPPAGWRVLGSVDADLVIALRAAVIPTERQPVPDEAPGPTSAHVLGWLQGDRRLSVLTLPGGEVDGLPGVVLASGSRFGVEARSANEVVLLDPVGARVLIREAPWGDLLVVGSHAQPEPLAVLRAVADSAEPIDAAAWDAFLVHATGGAGLAADPGFVEVARGRQGEHDWLLQANGSGLDNCVKLSNQRRVCADDGQMGSDGWFMQEAQAEPGKSGFLLLTVDGQDREVVVTSGKEVVRVPLAPIPGQGKRAAVVFLEETGPVGDCGDRPVPPTLHVVRADVVAADGSMRCLRFP